MDTTPKATTESEPEIETKPEIKYPHKPNSEATKWRYRPDGKYDTRPKLKDEYFRQYQRVWGSRQVQCPKCGRMSRRGELGKHQKRPICVYTSLALQALNNKTISL
jgi:hypothetical protein